MGGGQSKAAPTSHSISCSSGLGDLGVGGLVKRAFFIYLFSAFSLPVSLPVFHHCCPPSLPRSQITGPSSSWPCVEKEHATGSWAFRCFAFAAAAAAAAAATPPLPPPPPHSVSSRGGFSASSLGPREQGRPPGREEGQRAGSVQVPPAYSKGSLYRELCDRALGFSCFLYARKAFLVYMGTEPESTA